MAELSTLARPYAKAAFDLADERDATASWNDMLALASALVSEESMANLLQSPEVGGKQIVEILSDIAGESFDDRFRDYLSVLAENKRFRLIPEIAKLYQKLREDADKLLRVKVVSAFALDENQATPGGEHLMDNRIAGLLFLHDAAGGDVDHGYAAVHPAAV